MRLEPQLLLDSNSVSVTFLFLVFFLAKFQITTFFVTFVLSHVLLYL